MAGTTSPTPTRNRVLILLSILLLLLGAAALYVQGTQDHPPAWVELAYPLIMADMGLIFWFFPEVTHMSPVWRRRFAIFLFVLSALALIRYFV